MPRRGGGSSGLLNSPASGFKNPKSVLRPAASKRPVRIHNGNLKLRLDRRAIAAVIHALDASAAEILGPSPLGSRLPAPWGVPPGEL